MENDKMWLVMFTNEGGRRSVLNDMGDWVRIECVDWARRFGRNDAMVVATALYKLSGGGDYKAIRIKR